MIIPDETLSRLGSNGILKVSDEVMILLEEGRLIGIRDTVDSIKRIIIREKGLISVFPLDNKVDDEFIRGYTQAIENVEKKFIIKFTC